jgi:hypothetical protein
VEKIKWNLSEEFLIMKNEYRSEYIYGKPSGGAGPKSSD